MEDLWDVTVSQWTASRTGAALSSAHLMQSPRTPFLIVDEVRPMPVFVKDRPHDQDVYEGVKREKGDMRGINEQAFLFLQRHTERRITCTFNLN